MYGRNHKLVDAKAQRYVEPAAAQHQLAHPAFVARLVEVVVYYVKLVARECGHVAGGCGQLAVAPWRGRGAQLCCVGIYRSEIEQCLLQRHAAKAVVGDRKYHLVAKKPVVKHALVYHLVGSMAVFVARHTNLGRNIPGDAGTIVNALVNQFAIGPYQRLPRHEEYPVGHGVGQQLVGGYLEQVAGYHRVGRERGHADYILLSGRNLEMDVAFDRAPG